MEAETPPIITTEIEEIFVEAVEDLSILKTKRQSNGSCDDDLDSTIHGFNVSNVTVIERIPGDLEKSKINSSPESENSNKQGTGEGSDSGVEICGMNDGILQRALSSNSGGYASSCGIEAQSCDSSLLSCCSTYEDAYDLLARKNSTLLEDLKMSRGDGTSEGGSESSSVTGSTSSRPSKRLGTIKKKVAVNEPTKSSKNPSTKNVPRSLSSTPRVAPARSIAQDRSKSKERDPKVTTPRPSTLKTAVTNTPRPKISQEKPSNLPETKNSSTNKTRPTRSTSTSRTKTPVATPTDDGRWPSSNNRNNAMTRSFRGSSVTSDAGSIKSRVNQLTLEQKNSTIEKYATLPRRRRERSADNIRDGNRPPSREPSINRAANLRKQPSRESTPARNLPPYPKKKTTGKTRIYHEVSAQTCLTIDDVEKALAGVGIKPVNPYDVETVEKEIQVDRVQEKVELLEAVIKSLQEKNNKLISESKEHKEKLADVEQKLAVERVEKQALKDELERNMQRVQTILGNTEGNNHQGGGDDSLLVLESRFQAAGQVIIKQENEISELHSFCRSLQRDLEKSLAAQKILLQQQRELEAESAELQEFMQAEKSTLSEALHEAELKIKSFQQSIIQRDEDINKHQDECKHLVRISEQRRQENLALQARLGALESRSRDLLLHQGAAVSGTAVALAGLISRIDGFVEQLITSYSISDKDLEDVIFHNEAYSNSNSSTEGSPEKSSSRDKRTPSPKRGSSFVLAVITAIKNAAAQSPFANAAKLNNDDRSDSTEMLDSETEPCLMMENVLEDVSLPDGHSHNMISSTHSLMKSGMLGRSESLHNLSQAILNRQLSEQARMDGSLCDSMHASYSENTVSLSDICPTVTLVDQVIEADNLLTKLLKVLRIIQLENDGCINEIYDEKTELTDKLQKQRETNDKAAQQLKDWEILGARLKSELQDAVSQLNNRNREVDDLRADLQNHRQQIERLNQDVCDLSTTCSKAELQLKLQEEEATKILKEWQETGQLPSEDILSKIVAAKHEMPPLEEKLFETEKQLAELNLEYQANKQVLSENWNQAVSEARKQYEAIDTALETLHSIQSVVQQCPPLAKLQRDLEETSFQCASSMPFVSPDFNENAALLQAVANLQLTTSQATAINSTA